MEKLGFDLDDGSSPADAKQTNPQVIYEFILQIYFTITINLLHSYIFSFS